MNIHEHPRYSLTKAILIYAVTTLFLFYEMALQVSPSVMAGELMESFTIDAGGLGLLAGFYFYSYSLMQIPAGLLFDRMGARLIFVLAILVCAAGAFFFGNTHTVALAGLGRFLIGLGSAFSFTGVLVVSAFWFKPKRFALLVGLAHLFAALGAMGGAYPLAILVGIFDWRVVIVGLGFIGVFLAGLSWLIIRDHPRENLSHSNPVQSNKIMASLKQVFALPQNWWVALYAFASWSPMILFAALWGIPFFKVKFNVSNQIAASSLSLSWVGLAIISPMMGWLSDRMHNRRIIMIVSAILGVIASLVLIYYPNLPFGMSYFWMFLIGTASSGQILSFALSKDRNPPRVIGAAVGFNNMAVVLGGALFQPLVGLILRWTWDGAYKNNIPIYTSENYALALMIIPICYFVCALVSIFMIKETHCKPAY